MITTTSSFLDTSSVCLQWSLCQEQITVLSFSMTCPLTWARKLVGEKGGDGGALEVPGRDTLGAEAQAGPPPEEGRQPGGGAGALQPVPVQAQLAQPGQLGQRRRQGRQLVVLQAQHLR